MLIGALIVGEPITLSDYGATLLIFVGVSLLKRTPQTNSLRMYRSQNDVRATD